MANQPEFLTLEEVLDIHTEQLELYGGAVGILDITLVKSATSAPRATMDGAYLNEDLPTMAAAYLQGFAQSQGFRDGNKRTAAACCDVFLAKNGYLLDCDELEFYELTMAIANKDIDKEQAAYWIADHLKPLP